MIGAMDGVGNPSSVHKAGRSARRVIETARACVAALTGVPPAQVLFTGGGTEANNLALRGFPDRRVITTAIEHDSVLASAPDALRLPVDGHGVVDLAALQRALVEGTGPALVSIMLANNETGVIQPVREAAALAHAHGALLHCDVVQGAGRISVRLEDLGADLVTLSAHKLGGPTGIGALVIRDGVEPAPLVLGGGQERRRRAGTENVIGAAGFGAAAQTVIDLRSASLALHQLRARLEQGARAAIPEARVMGEAVPRVGNTSCLLLPGVTGETQVMALDLSGVCVSAGSACSSGKVKASHVLTAMGLTAGDAACAIRVSLGWNSAETDVDRFLAAWTAMAGAALRR